MFTKKKKLKDDNFYLTKSDIEDIITQTCEIFEKGKYLRAKVVFNKNVARILIDSLGCVTISVVCKTFREHLGKESCREYKIPKDAWVVKITTAKTEDIAEIFDKFVEEGVIEEWMARVFTAKYDEEKTNANSEALNLFGKRFHVLDYAWEWEEDQKEFHTIEILGVENPPESTRKASGKMFDSIKKLIEGSRVMPEPAHRKRLI